MSLEKAAAFKIYPQAIVNGLEKRFAKPIKVERIYTYRCSQNLKMNETLFIMEYTVL